jgi:hypothetical protein
MRNVRDLRPTPGDDRCHCCHRPWSLLASEVLTPQSDSEERCPSCDRVLTLPPNVSSWRPRRDGVGPQPMRRRSLSRAGWLWDGSDRHLEVLADRHGNLFLLLNQGEDDA